MLNQNFNTLPRILPKQTRSPLFECFMKLEAQYPRHIIFVRYWGNKSAWGRSSEFIMKHMKTYKKWDGYNRANSTSFNNELMLGELAQKYHYGLIVLKPFTLEFKEIIAPPTITISKPPPLMLPAPKITRLISIPEPPPLMLPAPKRILMLPVGDAPMCHPELSEPQIIFLEAFLETSYNIVGLSVNGITVEHPFFYPALGAKVIEQIKKQRQPSKTPDIIHLPAPVRNTHVYSNHNKSVDLLGFARDCKIIETFQKYDETWVKLSKTIGKHHMIIYRKLSQISQEQSC